MRTKENRLLSSASRSKRDVANPLYHSSESGVDASGGAVSRSRQASHVERGGGQVELRGRATRPAH